MAEMLSYKSMPISWRSSYEVIPLPAGDEMGVVGFHYDLMPFKSLPSSYLGFGGYGGAVGEEGGFFTMGATLGNRFELSRRLKLDLGYHFGGGGGSGLTFPGGGMITRAHAMLEFQLGGPYWRMGVAHTDFPNTTANESSDTHLVAGLRLDSFSWRQIFDNSESVTPYQGELERYRIMPSLMHYATDDDHPMHRSGIYTGGAGENTDFNLLGIQFDHQFSHFFYNSVELYGAGGGGSDGYASISAGLGARVPLFAGLNWESKALLGLAGDGRIDTGGGLTVHLMTGLSLELSEHWYVKAMAGRMAALEGEIKADAYEIGIG
ncbi:hypothetical protein [Candidatus Reidiella endopervernicosa]|nr:hypothetical protein [Candidatus Reidiella endopervernicosa]QKQ27266.1 hypothetical protein HUE57_13965 [Candidatus Reidiella endopervernicosa]